MSDVVEREKLFRSLSGNPPARQIAIRLLQLEDEKEAAYKKALAEYESVEIHASGVYKPFPWSGAEWFDCQASTQTLNALVVDGLLVTGGARGTFKSNNSQTFKLKDPELVRECLTHLQESSAGAEDVDIPGDLFDLIIGHEDIKKLMWKSISAPRPVHILLCGPPATAKTLFLGEICRLPLSRFTNGSSTTKAGLTDFLLEFRPKYLVIDEIDKMALDDMSTLLSLMESGIIARMKHKMREIEQLQTSVFAGCNRDDHIWPELKSRFFEVRLKEYTTAEFINVAVHVLVTREKVDPEIAKYIATSLITHTRDIREAVHIGRMSRTIDDVDDLMRLKWEERKLF